MLKRNKRIKQVSDKRRAINVERHEFVMEQLALRRWCEVPHIIVKWVGSNLERRAAVERLRLAVGKCQIHACELHEPLTRARSPGIDTITDEENSVATCRSCHDAIHDNVAASESVGLLVRSDGSNKKILPRRGVR